MEKLLLNQAEKTKTILENRTPPSKPNQTRQKPTQKEKDTVPNELFNSPAQVPSFYACSVFLFSHASTFNPHIYVNVNGEKWEFAGEISSLFG